MKNRKCPSCGATLTKADYFCDYCGTDWTPPPAIEPGKSVPSMTPMPTPGTALDQPGGRPKPKSSAAKVLVFFVLAFFCGPIALIYMWAALPWSKKVKSVITVIIASPLLFILIYGLCYETIYAVRLDSPKFNVEPLRVDQRPVETVNPVDVYRDLRDAPDSSIDLRKSTWLEHYQGKWVEWEGEVNSVVTYSSSASELLVILPGETPVAVEIYFDPMKNAQLDALSPGSRVRFSGMLWGYYFLADIVRVADGALLNVQEKEPEPAETIAPAA